MRCSSAREIDHGRRASPRDIRSLFLASALVVFCGVIGCCSAPRWSCDRALYPNLIPAALPDLIVDLALAFGPWLALLVTFRRFLPLAARCDVRSKRAALQ